MKALSKVGVIGAAAALVVLAGAAPAMADSADGTQDLTGTLDGTSAVTVPAAASFALTADNTVTPDAGNVVVFSNEGYTLSVSDANNGKLTDTGNNNAQLVDPLKVKSTTTATDGATAFSTLASLVGSSDTAVEIGSSSAASDPMAGDSYDVGLSQQVTWADAPSSASGYTDTLTYTVAPQVVAP